MSTPERLRITVVYADPETFVELKLEVAVETSVDEAIHQSGIYEVLPSGFKPAGISVFGRLVSPTTQLHDGDRIELCRPLRIDPKQARRKRAGDQLP